MSLACCDCFFRLFDCFCFQNSSSPSTFIPKRIFPSPYIVTPISYQQWSRDVLPLTIKWAEIAMQEGRLAHFQLALSISECVERRRWSVLEWFWCRDAAGKVYGIMNRVIEESFGKEKSLSIKILCVDPRHMKEGVGSVLVAQVEWDAIAMGISVVEVFSHQEASEFYLRRGFLPLENRPGPFYKRLE